MAAFGLLHNKEQRRDQCAESPCVLSFLLLLLSAASVAQVGNTPRTASTTRVTAVLSAMTLALKAIVEKAMNHGNKRESLQACDKWDRRRQDVKAVINEISFILDSKHVHWTVRVGTAIGASRPTGELAVFLEIK